MTRSLWIVVPLLVVATFAPVAFAQSFPGQTKLTPQDGEFLDRFGFDVAVDAGAWAAVGAYRNNGAAINGGAVYVYRREADRWSFFQKIFPPDLSNDDNFGVSVAIDGNTLAVGSFDTDTVFVYEFDGASWNEVQRIAGTRFQSFGSAVALSGDLLVVGDLEDRIVGFRSGSVSVYRHDGTAWQFEQKLFPADLVPFDEFGGAVAVHGDAIVAGARRDDDLGTSSGAAYVFRHDGSSWIEEAKLLASDGARSDEFGSAVAIEGGVAVVGAPGAANPGASFSGAAYAYRFDGAAWNQEGRLTLPDPDRSDLFGFTVAIEGTRIVGGAFNDDVPGLGRGSAASFVFDGAAWNLEQHLLPRDVTDSFGREVAVDGGVIIVGAIGDDHRDRDAGAAYIFEPTTAAANFPPTADAGGDAAVECDSPAGTLVTLDGSASSDPDSTPGTNDDLVDFEWLEDLGQASETSLAADETADVLLSPGGHDITLRVIDRKGDLDTDRVTRSVDDTLPPAGGIVFPANGSCHGAADLPVTLADNFADACSTEVTRVYSLPETIVQPDGLERIADFGQALAVDGGVMVVGAPDQRNAGGFLSGVAYVYRNQAGVWTLEQELIAANTAQFDGFGFAVDVSGNRIVVGAPGADTNGFASGAAYVFEFDGAQWVETAELDFIWGRQGDFFGTSVAIDGDVVVAGAPRNERFGGFDIGMVAVFGPVNGSWQMVDQLLAGDRGSSDRFGTAVDVDGDLLIASAPLNDDQGTNSGSIYVFRKGPNIWLEEAELQPSGGTRDMEFGSTLKIDGNVIVGGTPDWRFGRDEAYVFRHDGAFWQEEALIVPPGDRAFGFGSGIDLDGSTLLIGAQNDNEPLSQTGSAFVFEHDGAQWQFRRKLLAAATSFRYYFGSAVGITDDDFLIGARGANDGGSVFVYDRTQAGPDYDGHGSKFVQLTARDPVGNEASDAVSFVIDVVPPNVVVFDDFPDRLALPTVIPFTDLFAADDDDGAEGDVVLERLYFDGCLAYDGATYGDGDGRLLDEDLVLDAAVACEILARCELPSLDEPEMRVEATDCGGNTGTGSRSIPFDPSIAPVNCQVDLELAKSGIGTAELSWSPKFEADAYDVFRGDVTQLAAAGGVVDLGPGECLAERSAGTALADADVPPPGTAWFYAVDYRYGSMRSEYGYSSLQEPERTDSCSP